MHPIRSLRLYAHNVLRLTIALLLSTHAFGQEFITPGSSNVGSPLDWVNGGFFDFLGQSDDASTGLDMAGVFSNLALQIDPIKNFLIVLCYVVGVGLSIAAVMKLKKYGTRTAFMSVEMSMVGPFLQFFIGVGLFYMPYFISAINLTIFTSSGVQNELGYSVTGVDYNTYIEPVLGIIQIIGIIAFMRGWLLLAKATNPGQQPGAISKGVTHIVGGILAVNIRTFITVIYQTLGLS
jgi:intracellular multiplication protein IcmC